jgi:acetyl esterase/lipase
MKYTLHLFAFAFLQLLASTGFGQSPADEIVYKKIDTTELKMKFYRPVNFTRDKKYPAIVLFFGGGWNSGSIKQLEPQAKHYASLGMIAITADYRVKNRQHTTPFESVMDGKSAIRYVRTHAGQLGIDKNKIAAGGGSAGGHVAAATDLTNLDEPGEDLSVSSRPNALVLFNPVFNNGPGNYGYERLGERYKEISPFHNIKKGAAPTAVFLGTADKLIPTETAKQYKEVMEANGNRCDLFLYEGQPHGFFNYKKNTGENKYYEETLNESVRFLTSLGYIKK